MDLTRKTLMFVWYVSIASCAILFGGREVANAGWTTTTSSSESRSLDSDVVSKFRKFDGKTVRSLRTHGLRRTQERAVRWLVKTSEGTNFSSEQLARDVQTLYNTANLYEIYPEVQVSKDDPTSVEVVINMSDKWTLLPVVGAQGGGGGLTYGGGIYDTNLFGYLITGSFFGYNYNGALSYDLSFSQEYVGGSPLMASIGLSDTISPTVIHQIDGQSAGTYVWQRKQKELMLGTHFEGPVRLMVYGDYFEDALLDVKGLNTISVVKGPQYKLRPKIIFGRVNIVEFYEEGQEFTIDPAIYNIFGPANTVQSLEISYKAVTILPRHSNFAYIIDGAAMNSTQTLYEFMLGGYNTVRGFIEARQIGHYFARTNIEYRPYLFSWKLPFFDLDRAAFQGVIFTDAGAAFGDSLLTGDPGSENFRPLWSAGLGLRANFLHFAGAIIRLDVARTIRPDEGFGIAFGVGQFF